MDSISILRYEVKFFYFAYCRIYPGVYHNVGLPPNNPLTHRIPFIQQPAVVHNDCNHNANKNNKKEMPIPTPMKPSPVEPDTPYDFDLSNRFGEDDTTQKPFQHALTDDDRPIWGVVDINNNQPAQIPTNNNILNKGKLNEA